jgi:hypothetical protein
MDHGGQPGPGSNPFITIDGTNMTLTDPAIGADLTVIPVGTTFQVAMEFTLAGTFAAFLVGLPINYTIHYTFDGRGVPDGPPLTVGPKPTTAGQLVYKDPDTTATVPANTLPPGVYEVTASVTFGGAPPMSAFIDIPVIEVF